MNRLRGTICGALCLLLIASCSDEASVPDQASPTLFDAPAQTEPGLAPELTIPEGSPTIAFLGDSIPAGLHLAEHQAFPALLQARLAAESLPFKLVNASESGRTTAGGASAVRWVLRSKPDVLVIALGGNDGLRGIQHSSIESNLRQMIEVANEAGTQVLLLGVRLPENYGDYGTSFDALYPKLAAEYGIEFVPYYMEGVGGVPEMNLEDGLHPTLAGQQHLADNVLPKLRELLAR